MSITSNEVNFLIYRYMQESGFHHSAFTFGHESYVFQSNINGTDVPPGALITIVQKGLQYVEAETHLTEDGAEIECGEPFSLLTPHVCKAKDGDKERKRKEREEKRPDKKEAKRLKREHSIQNTDKTDDDDRSREKGREKERERDGEKKNKQKEKEKNRSKEREKNREKDKTRDKEGDKPHKREWDNRDEDDDEAKRGRDDNDDMDDTDRIVKKDRDDEGVVESSGCDEVANKREGSAPRSIQECIDDESFKITHLKGHSTETPTFTCTWNPTSPLLATGSDDSTVRLWDMSTADKIGSSIVLAPEKRDNIEPGGVTSIDWNAAGTILGTGSLDGHARLWCKSGKLLHTLEHTAKVEGSNVVHPVFGIKFSKTGRWLLSASADNTATVWDPTTGALRQRFSVHTASVMDADWLDDEVFATGGQDKMVQLCKLGEDRPIRTFKEEMEVMKVRFNPTGTLLASCTDGPSVMIWKTDRDECVHRLDGHKEGVASLAWSYDINPGLLVSGGNDGIVKIWDIETGQLLHNLNHDGLAYTVEFSPDSKVLVSGSPANNYIAFWDVKSGKQITKVDVEGGPYDLSWNSTGTMLGASLSRGMTAVVDFRTI